MSNSDKPSIFRTAAIETASQVRSGLWRLFQMALALIIVFGGLAVVGLILTGIFGSSEGPSQMTSSGVHGGHPSHDDEIDHKPKRLEVKPRGR